jgi:putative flavoprotein involved in K+ transport
MTRDLHLKQFLNLNHMELKSGHCKTIIIGAGQAGLATGYYLKKLNEEFLVIEGSEKIGDVWRKRWDSLKLFTPPQFNRLPGWADSGTTEQTTKDAMADYLKEYARRFDLPVRTGIHVNHVSKKGSLFVIGTSDGVFTCDNLVISTGSNHIPRIPAIAEKLNPGIYQIHSSEYRNPDALPPGDVLVVGSGVSGIEIAVEVSSRRYTMIAGEPSSVIPKSLFKFGPKFYWWFINNIATIKTPIGKKLKPVILKGGGVLPQHLDALRSSKVEQVLRVNNVSNGRPQLADGKELSVATIIWCTGYKADFSWIDMKITDETGWPLTQRGISLYTPSLYFVGMLFQYALSSNLVGGVGRDAGFIAKHIHDHPGTNGLAQSDLLELNTIEPGRGPSLLFSVL